MGRLERKLDQDLIDRILANGPIKKQPRTKSRKEPRPAETYRGHPGYSAQHEWQPEPPELFRKHVPPTRLNRSKKWKVAKTYDEARAQRHGIAKRQSSRAR